MINTLGWKTGFEFELLAPRGSSRRTLADALASRCAGSVRPCFHAQSELSEVPGTPIFENLTQGFEILDTHGAWVARCVDDITLQNDLDPTVPSVPGWFRIVSDDRRLLHLIARVGRADASALDALTPVGLLFGMQPEVLADGMIRITDQDFAPVAIAAPLHGERERGCEVITPPLTHDHAQRIEALLQPARQLGFTLAAESATHVHFDAAPLRDARVFANLVTLLHTWGPTLKQLVGTNPECRRLGDWPPALHETVAADDFRRLGWPQAQARLQLLGLTKFCDFNLKNLVHDVADKPTFEVRILPGTMDAHAAVANAKLFESILRYAMQHNDIPANVTAAVDRQASRYFICQLALEPPAREFWLHRLEVRITS